MSKGEERIRDSIFARLTATFLLAIGLIIALGIYMYNWSLTTVKNEIINSSTAQVSFYLKSLEEEIERIKTLQYDSLNDEYLTKLAIQHSIMDQYEIVESMRKLQQRLVSIRNSNSYISDVRAYISPIQKTISAVSSVRPFDSDKFQNLRVPEGLTGAQLVQYEDGLYLTTLHGGYSGLSQLYMIEIKLDKAALQEALGQFHTYANSGSFLVDLTNDVVMSSETNNSDVDWRLLMDSYRKNESDTNNYTIIPSQNMYVVAVKSDYLNMVLLRYIPQQLIFVPVQSFYIWLWIFTGVGLLIMILYSVYTYNLIHKPMRRLVGSFRRVEDGNFNVHIPVHNKNEFRYLYQGFNSMVQNVSALIDQVYKQKILNQKAELKQLQSQISPHFLYNSLFLINTMAKLKDDNLLPFTKLLGEYFQFITRNDSDFLPLSQEIDHAKTYTGIQAMRFPSRLSLDFGDCPEAVKNWQVPRLIIQPILENAFKYAVEKTKGIAQISIVFYLEEQVLRMVVEDNGSLLTDKQLSSMQKMLYDTSNIETSGLVNIHRRLQIVYGDSSGLRFERSELGGMKVTLRLDPKVRGDHVQTADRG